MSNTQKLVTEFMEFVEIEGSNGTTYIPADYAANELSTLVRSGWGYFGDDPKDVRARELAGVHYDGTVYLTSPVEGYGAKDRATEEWSVFETEEEAYAYLEDHNSRDFAEAA